jgi:hypothetical protein
MRAKYLLFFIAVFIANSKCQSQSKANDEQVVTMLKEFYTSYITVISESKDSMEFKLDSIKLKYCTLKLIKQIADDEELDYDPFLNAQDAHLECLQTLTILKDPNSPNFYCISYVDNYSKRQITIKLGVVKQKNKYKIDSIE